MDCELCGASNANKKISLEGAILNVCSNCASHGKEVFIAGKTTYKKRDYTQVEEPDDFELVEGFGKIIQREMQKRQWKQEDLARKIAVKKSIVSDLEKGIEPPTLKNIKKIEQLFNVKLRA